MVASGPGLQQHGNATAAHSMVCPLAPSHSPEGKPPRMHLHLAMIDLHDSPAKLEAFRGQLACL